MVYVAGISALIVISVGFLPVVYFFDRRWYRRHPGVEERFAKLDAELERKGR